MTDTQKKSLEDAGIDTASALERFMNNDALFEKYLIKFTTNPTYSQLQNALKNKDCKACFDTTHALKGNTGTLSIMTLFKMFSEQTDYFRANDFEHGEAMSPKIDAEYSRVVNVIKETFNVA